MAGSLSSTLFLLLLITISSCEQCYINTTNVRSSSREDQSSSTTRLLLSLTKSFRSSFFSSTNYASLRHDIQSLYTNEKQFSEFTFIGTAISYCKEAQFLAAFVLLISILLPCVLSILWCLWERCSVSADVIDDDEDLLNKHLSVAAQIVSWCLACSIILLLMIMVGLAAILVIGDQIVDGAVVDSDTAIKNTIPTINALHTDFLKAVNTSLVMGYQSVNESIYDNELRFISNMLANEINSSLPYTRVDPIIQVASDIVRNLHVAQDEIAGLASFHQLHSETLAVSIDSATIINNNLATILQICNQSVLNYEPCNSILMSNDSSNISIAVSDLVDNSSKLLLDIDRMLDEVSNDLTVSSIMNRITEYNRFIKEIETNVSDHVIATTQSFLLPIDRNVSNVTNTIYQQLGDIHYGLPHSQELVEEALSNRYLSNWNEFRSLATIAFSLSLIVFFVGVVLAIARGLISTCGIYMYGEESGYTVGSHLAALMLKNFVTWIAIVGVVSAFFFVFILCLASLVGRGCGNHGNYSRLIDDVIDNNDTWGGVYPLGLTYFDDPAHSLTLSSVISSCSKGYTASRSLQLLQLIDINSLIPSMDVQTNYIEVMKAISSLVSFSEFHSLLGWDIIQSLLQYQSITSTIVYPWGQYNELNEQILNTSLDLQLLSDILTHPSFNESFSVSDQEYLYIIIQNITDQMHILNDTVFRYETELTKARSNASNILLTWEQVHNTTNSVIADNNQLRTRLIKEIVDKLVERYTLAIATNISRSIVSSLTSYIDDLYCNVSVCYPLVVLFDDFSDATCTRLIKGLDVYWSVLLLIFIMSDISVILIITLACHLADKEIFEKANNPKIPRPYYHSEQILAQLTSFAWLVLSFGVHTWLVIAIATDDQFTCDNPSCCAVCYWVFGVIFLLVCLVFCTVLKIYQFIVLRRIRAYRGGGKAQQVQRYWLVRLRATLFYEGLLLFFVMYVPFTAIAGSYITVKGFPTSSSFSALLLSLCGILMFIIFMVKDRSQMMEYIHLLQQMISMNWCCHEKDSSQYPPVTNNSPTNGDITGNGGVVDDKTDNGGVVNMNDMQLTAIPEDGHVTDYAHNYEMETMEVPVIMEHDNEGAEQEAETQFINDDDSIIMGESPLFEEQAPFDENEIIEEQAIEEQVPPSILLDGLQGGAGHQRQPNNTLKNRGGVRLAHSYLSQQTDMDGSTPRSSLYMSEDSVTTGSELPPYYHSSSHVPGYSTDESSYRDDYDSYESDYTTNYYGGGQFDSKQVEV